MRKLKGQCAELLEILQSGRSITHYEAAQIGIMGFAARIYDLRRAGYPVVCVMEDYTNKHGQKVKRGRYSLLQRETA